MDTDTIAADSRMVHVQPAPSGPFSKRVVAYYTAFMDMLGPRTVSASQAFPFPMRMFLFAHEAAHGLALGMAPPWCPQKINRRLRALTPRTRIDHEIRANLIAARVIKCLKIRVVAPLGLAKGTALIYLNERYQNGNVGGLESIRDRVVREYMAGGGPLHREAMSLLPRARLAAARVERTRDLAADTRTILAMARDFKNPTRSRKSKP